MDILTVTVLLLGGFAEASALAAVGLSLVGLNYDRGALLLTGFLQAILLCAARALPFRVGVHTYLLIVTMMLLMHYLLQVRPLAALIASLTGMCTLALVETAAIPLYSGYFAVSQAEILARPFLRLGIICLNAAILSIILLLIKATGFAFIRSGQMSDGA